jgi:chromosomal replication initiation ATPase DnaA
VCGSSFGVRAADAGADLEIASRLAFDVSRALGVVPEVVFAENRDRRSTMARAEVARRLRDLGWSYPRIGAVLGRHHTSVMYLVKETAR